jgi:AcrR family transcriptional regulator
MTGGAVGSPREPGRRVPGRRGSATRRRLLESVTALLASTPYRALTVTDVARAAETSPATFYQYFAGIEDAVIALAGTLADDETLVAALRSGRRWRGAEGWTNAAAVVDGFLTFWIEHQPVLRVVDLLTEEGDARLRAVRVRMLNAVTRALAGVIEDARAAAGGSGRGEAMALAGVLVSMLAHVAAHQRGFEDWHIPVEDVRRAMTDVLYWGITGPPVPEGLTRPDEGGSTAALGRRRTPRT